MADPLIEAILLGLAGWRIAHLLVEEEGPGLVFQRLREKVGLKPGPVSGFFPRLFSCVYCLSVWTTSVMYILWLVEPEAVMIIASWAVAVMVHSVAGFKE